MGNLADLTVKIGADDSELDGELKTAESKVSKFADGLKVAGAAAGAGAGALLAAGFAKNLEFETAQAKLGAQLGAGSALAEDAGKVAGSLYANAYGQSLGEVSEAVRTVIDSGAVMEDATTEQIETITARALSLSDAFGQDVTATMAAVGQMMRTGMAPDAETAMDIITRGFQQGNDKAGDMLDTLNEYSTQFRKVGIDGTAAMGLISQGLKAGARDSDIVADSIKEFSIRAIDGSKLTAEGFTAIGLSADDMAAKIAAGGPTAAAALDMTLDRLRAMEDPVARDAAAVALFGTQAEDLGAALFALDPSEAVAAMGEVAGAAAKVDEALGDTAQAKITAMQRSVELWTASLVTAEGPLGDIATTAMAFGGPAVDMAGSLGMVAVATRGLGIASLFTGGALRAMWVAATGPIGIAVTIIVALIALIVANWDTVKSVSIAVWNAVWGFVSEKVAAIAGFVALKIGEILGFIDYLKALPGRAAEYFGAFVAAAINKGNEVVGYVRGLPGRILDSLGDLRSLLWGVGQSVIDGFWSGIRSMGSWLKSQILGFIKSFVPGPVLQFLGISSPSKLFEGIGRNVGLGLAEGITSSQAVVASAAARLAEAAAVTGAGVLSESGRAAQQILDQLNSGGQVFEDFSFRGSSGLVGRHNDEIADAFGRSGSTDPRQFLGDYIRSQQTQAPAPVLEIRSGGSELDDLLLKLLRRALRGRGLQGVIG